MYEWSKISTEENCMVNFQLCRHHLFKHGIGYQRNYRIDHPLSHCKRDKEVS